MESVDRGRLKTDHLKLRTSLQSVEEVRYMPESTEEEDSMSEDDLTEDEENSEEDIEESVVLEHGLSLAHQSYKIRRSLSDNRPPTHSPKGKVPKWPSENILTITR